MKPGERQVAPVLDGIRRDHRARYEWAARCLPAGERVLDLACGVGYGSLILARNGHRVTAIDRDAEAIAYARRHYGHKNVAHRVLDAAGVGARRGRFGRFDVAVMFEVVEHLADPAPVLRAVRRSARTLFVSVPNEDVFPFTPGMAHHVRHYRRLELQGLLARAGWRVDRWLGQQGPASDVVDGCVGRTLVAACTAAAVPRRHPAKKPKPPRHVAIVGLGPSSAQYLDLAKRLGGRRRVADEVWVINALGGILAGDRVFHMDDVRVQERRARADPDDNIAAMIAWMKAYRGPVPIVTSFPDPRYPCLAPFPLEDVYNDLKILYFNNTAAYAVAYAVWIGVGKISVYGCDYTYANSHQAEKGRGCLEFWLGFAAGRGIELRIANTSSLLDANVPKAERLYGYDGFAVDVSMEDGQARLTFTPRKLPTAAEIEARYDHSKPTVESPSPI